MTIKANELQRIAVMDAVEDMMDIGIEQLVDTNIIDGQGNMVAATVSVLISLLATILTPEALQAFLKEVVEANSTALNKDSLKDLH